MTDENKKLLTEYMGDCWHEPGDQVSKESPVMQCAKCKKYYHPMSGFHTFTTREDMMDLYEAIAKKGEWDSFDNYSWNYRKGASVNLAHAAWLFCLDGEGYESRCQMVVDWVKEASHD